MKNLLRKIPFAIPIVRAIRNARGITTSDLKLEYYTKKRDTDIQQYLKSDVQKKLQIGCQDHPMPDWLNADINPIHDEVVLMDATQPFPLPSDTFDIVFSEHMIEHIEFQEGLFMVKECYRVMKKGGVIRLATPNLKFLIDLYREPKTQTQLDYIQFAERYFKDDRPLTDAIVINNFFRDWGHKFIYDFNSLSYILTQAGFKDIKQCEVYKSEHPALQNLEKHAKELGEELNLLETFIIEATK